MSSRIGRCPQCGHVGSHTHLPGAVLVDLIESLGANLPLPDGWTARAAWCPDCQTPYLIVWPAKCDQAERFRLAGLTGENGLLRIAGETL